MNEREAAHVDPSSPIPCEACEQTCVIATKEVGRVYCAACGREFVVECEVWQSVFDRDMAYLGEQERLEAQRAEVERTTRQLEAWEARGGGVMNEREARKRIIELADVNEGLEYGELCRIFAPAMARKLESIEAALMKYPDSGLAFVVRRILNSEGEPNAHTE